MFHSRSLASIVVLALVGLSPFGVQAADSCGLPGELTTYEEASGRGYMFYSHRGAQVIHFKLPGREFAFDRAAPPGTVQFMLDGIHYQLVFNSVDVAGRSDGLNTHESVLHRYAAWEHAYAKSQGSPLTQFDDLGDRARASEGRTPRLLFNLARWTKPGRGDAAQFTLATVAEKEIVALVAIVPGRKDLADRFSAAIRLYRESFSYVGVDACAASSGGPDESPAVRQGP